MLIISSIVMAFAWLGHLKFKELDLLPAILLSWLIVLPEYALNVAAIRWGHGTFTGAQMAALNLSSGVVFVFLMSKVVLGEQVVARQVVGFALMAVAVILIMSGKKDASEVSLQESKSSESIVDTAS